MRWSCGAGKQRRGNGGAGGGERAEKGEFCIRTGDAEPLPLSPTVPTAPEWGLSRGRWGQSSRTATAGLRTLTTARGVISEGHICPHRGAMGWGGCTGRGRGGLRAGGGAQQWGQRGHRGALLPPRQRRRTAETKVILINLFISLHITESDVTVHKLFTTVQ